MIATNGFSPRNNNGFNNVFSLPSPVPDLFREHSKILVRKMLSPLFFLKSLLWQCAIIYLFCWLWECCTIRKPGFCLLWYEKYYFYQQDNANIYKWFPPHNGCIELNSIFASKYWMNIVVLSSVSRTVFLSFHDKQSTTFWRPWSIFFSWRLRKAIEE